MKLVATLVTWSGIWLLASCGPESYHQGLEALDSSQDAVAEHVDAAPDVAEDLGPEDTGPVDTTPCTTTVPGDLLYAFDSASSVFTGLAPDPAGPLPPNWFAYPEPASSAALKQSSTSWSAVEGHLCPGAMKLDANFTVYGFSEKVMALINFSANWAVPKAYVRLHAWIKIQIPPGGNLDHLAGIQLAANTNNFTAFLGVTVDPSMFGGGDWQEVVLNLTPASNYVPSAINQNGVQVIAKSSAPASSSAPVPTTMFVDDIWVEAPP